MLDSYVLLILNLTVKRKEEEEENRKKMSKSIVDFDVLNLTISKCNLNTKCSKIGTV